MMKSLLLIAATAAAVVATPAVAAQFTFNFSGQNRTAMGTLTTLDTPSSAARGGYTAFQVTGITGTLTVGSGSPLTITGLNGFVGSDNLYYTTGPSFVDGSGIGFTTSDGGQTSLFYQDSAPSYRITTTAGGFAGGFVTASSAAVTAVPEPAAWAMLLVGFAMVGAASRYRRKGVTVSMA